MKNDFSKITIVLFLSLIIASLFNFKSKTQGNTNPKVEQIFEQNSLKPENPHISVKLPPFQTYPQIVNQLKKWKEEAKDLTEIDTYGQTKNGKDLYYIRINNKFSNAKKPVILMTAAIHGNEPLSTSITMAYIGFLLDSYGKSKEITDLMNTRDLYFIPVISPESYPDSRTVGEVDPNRDFPTPKNSEHQSIPIIMALREFYWKIKPSAVISGHTYGRIFMTPYGDNHANTPHEADYNRIVGRMSEIANYKKIHCVDLYTKPIDGSEVDWFYRNGSIAVCAEYGTHQNIPTLDEIKSEFFRVKDAITYFITESPNVVVKVTDEGIDFSKNTGISRKYSRLPNGDLIPAGPYQNPD